MTPRKKSHAKAGPKSPNIKKEQNDILREQFLKDGVTPWQAALIAKCSYPYACQKFREFGAELVENEDQDWLERNEQARKRALEGLARDIILTETRITRVNKQLNAEKEVHDSIMGNMIMKAEETEFYNEIQNIIGELDQKKILQIYKMLDSSLNMQKNYGYYIATLESKVQEFETFKAELKAQYDTIEILPSPKAIFEAEMEKRIAERNAINEKTPQ